MSLNPKSFVSNLGERLQAELAIRVRPAAADGEPIQVRALLEVALRNELEAAEEAALWLVDEPSLPVKLALARQCGDEAKHYRLIEARLRDLGVDVRALNPLKAGPSPMFIYLRSLASTVERVAAGPFAREGLALVRNRVFIELCEKQGDPATASLYRELIQPDEEHHHHLGQALLEELAIDEESQARATAAAMKTLEVASEMQEIAKLRFGITCAPGC